MSLPHPDRAAVARIAATIRAEMASLERTLTALRGTIDRHPEPDPEIAVVHGTGGLLHDFYTGVEKALAAVTPALNGLEPGRDAWHRELLRSAVLDLPGVRPPILCEDTADRLAEYLAFRHVYRHLYAFNLRWQRLRGLAAGADALWPHVRADLDRFLGFLDATVQLP